MLKIMSFFTICLILLSGIVQAQEVVVTDFPLGVGSTVDQSFFKKYHTQLNAVADTLKKYPEVAAMITGGADGMSYRSFHDNRNSSIALSRAHALQQYMIDKFAINQAQLIVSSEESQLINSSFRHATIRVIKNFENLKKEIVSEMNNLENRIKTLESQPPVEKHFTEIKEIIPDIKYDLGLRLSIGLSSSPFGGIPVVAGAVRWQNKVFIEAILGHTFWNNSFNFLDEDLDTKKRLFGGLISYYPSETIPIGIVGGWIRMEEVSQKYYEYVELSEGPMIGAEAKPFDFIILKAVFNPTKRRLAGFLESDSKNGQFLISASYFMLLGD